MLVSDAPDYRPGAPLPGFRPVSDAIRAALPALSPPARVSVSEVAARRMIHAGGHWMPWDNGVAPYMVEPMDATLSRRFEAVVFVGPARSSKTEAMIINPLVHAVLAAPRLVAVFHMTQSAAREFSVQDLGPIIRNSPELARRLRLDNDHEKRFDGGARVTIDWPVPNKLAGRSIPLVLMSDYDAMPQDVGGEGSPFALGRKRITSAGTRGMVVAESSPRFPVLNETWTPATPHEAPPCHGILGLYNMGTRARLYWTCPDCGGRFEPTFDRLQYPEEGTPAERGAAAFMACLHCGAVIEPRHKAELNRSAVWLHESADGAEVVPLGDGVLKSAIASYWLPGPAAALAPWSTLVARYLEGVEAYESTGDETALKSAYNLDLGLPYTPRAMSEDAAISEAALREAATDHGWQTAPADTRFLLAAVDVQVGRFVVQVMAHLPHGERVLVDRFDIHTPPPDAPRAGDRQIDPARYGEDWAALHALAELSYPVAAADHRLRLAGVVVDAGGAPGVTPNAYAFWRDARRRFPRRFHLIRGVGGLNVTRAEVRAPETAHQGRRHVARDVQLIRAATDRLKDEVAAALLRTDRGARAIHIPRGAPAEVFAEFAAERRTEKGWRRRPGVKRNEALDLAVYDLALAIVLGEEKLDPSRPPAWAAPGAGNAFALLPDAASSTEHESTTPPPQAGPKRRRARRPRRRFDGWD